MTDFNQLRDRIAQVDGGELVDLSPNHPYSVVFPSTQSCAVIYITKIHVASQLLWSPDEDHGVGMIGGYGLPRDDELLGIAKFVRDHSVYFLGDCDPFDLLVFAWLQKHLSIRFLGTSDSVVRVLGVSVNDRITIPLSSDEQRAMSLVREVWPDFATSVGPVCAELLGTHRKLELEALVSYRTRPASGLLDLLR